MAGVGDRLSAEDHPTEGRTAVIRPAIRIDGDYPAAGTPAAPRGWDTRDLLSELGYTPAAIHTFVAEGAVYTYEA